MRIFPSVAILWCVLALTPLSAQENTFHQIGIAGKDDSKGRTPDLFVRTIVKEGRVQILADARQRHEDLVDFPIQFDFFINRKLFTSQIRSPELPGPIGVDIGPDIAPVPFNYMIVATTLTPNGRPFTTVLPGAVFASNLARTFDCTVLVGGENGNEYLKNDASSSQLGNDTFSLSFDAKSLTDSDTLTVTGTFTVSGGTEVSGKVTYLSSAQGSVAASKDLSGSASFSESSSEQLQSLTLLSGDDQFQIRCS
ncbi:MAG: hypothetical protein KDD64_11105 [Bdellovibrionales bacterium]|nr:hypothetical protein [Bdellovibrionales bacterium]